MLAVRLAEELLACPPSLSVEPPPSSSNTQRGGGGGKKGRRFNPAGHHVSLLASATLAKVAFLCSVLGESHHHQHLAFRVGLFGLEVTRPPASTKALEVCTLVGLVYEIVWIKKKLKGNFLKPGLDRIMRSNLVDSAELPLKLEMAEILKMVRET